MSKRVYVLRCIDKCFGTVMFFNGNYKAVMPINVSKLANAKKYKTMDTALKGFNLFKYNFGEAIAQNYIIDIYETIKD